MLYSLHKISGQNSSVIIVTDLTKAERPMNRILSPTVATDCLFSSSNTHAMRPFRKASTRGTTASDVKITIRPHLHFEIKNAHSPRLLAILS